MSNEQAVNDTNAESKTPAEEVVAQEDNLDTLLSEFDDKTKKDEVDTTGSDTKEPTVSDFTDEDRQLLKSIKEDKQKEQFKEVYKSVRGELDAEFYDDDFIDAWLSSQAKKDDRIYDAYAAKEKNPEAFKKILEGLNKKLSERGVNKTDKEATDNHEAVVAAVRSASTTTPQEDKPLTNAELGSLTDAEFQKLEASMR